MRSVNRNHLGKQNIQQEKLESVLHRRLNTAPGYESYARSLAEDMVPEVQRLLRIGNHQRYRTVSDSSPGGVVVGDNLFRRLS
jgi:hypothetical protein